MAAQHLEIDSRKDDARADLLAMRRALAESEAQLALLAQGIAERDRRIADLETSGSWRITGPLRYAGDLVRRVLFNTPPARQQLALRVLDKDPELIGDGNGQFHGRAATLDPQCIARTSPGGVRLPPGWYAVSVKLVRRGGQLAAPRLYVPGPDGGYSELQSVQLEPVDGAYATDIFLSRHTSELRFDPSIYPCDFDCGPVNLTRVSGVGRWLNMAAGLLRIAARLNRDQLSLCAHEGYRALRSQGLHGLLGAAFWAFANHARAARQLTLHVLEKDPALIRDGKGEFCWHAATLDPQFIARTSPGGACLPPGWYGVSVKLVQRDGQLAGPRLYVPTPDGGHSEFHSVELKLVDGAYVTEIFLSHPVSEFRFDPSIYPCDFDCEPVNFTRVSGAGRWLNVAAGLLRTAGRLNRDQLSFCVHEGYRALRSQGPRALLGAAFWAFTSHSRGLQAGYAAWVGKYATPSVADLAEMAEECRRLDRQPLISLITPVYNPPEPYLRAMFESVLRQAYPRWELCLADDASTAPHVRPIIEEYAARDPRIKVAWRDSNGHISAASNTAIGLATGDFLALLDHDDELTPDALCWVVKELNDHPDAALVYSDEDKLDFNGSLAAPYFKSDWNYDLFLSHNLITHLGVYRADVVRAIGGFRDEFTGAQDYDLALRFIERIEPSQIRHIPRVLYHWRMLRGSTSIGAGEKSYAAERSRKAIAEHLQRKGIAGSVEIVPDMGTHRVRYHVPQPGPLVSIIIPTRNARDLVHACIESIVGKTSYSPYEILLVDNGSDDPEALKYFHDLRDRGVIRLLDDPLPFNYPRLNNAAAKQARGDYLVLLNNDTEIISPEWLTEMVSHAQRPEIGAVGVKLWYPDDTIQHAGVVLVAGLAAHPHSHKPRGDHGYMGRANLIQALSAVTSACVCFRRSVFEEIGGLDEALAIAFSDVDICLRIQAAGYRNLYTPYAELYHYESATRGVDDTPAKMQRFQKEADLMRARWMPVLLNDPYYNLNLALTGEPFSLGWPPRVKPFRTKAHTAQ